MKKTYFITDAHLGSWAIKNGREQEKRVVRFLDSIKHEAQALYMLGDMFDFWHEYRYAVPRGFTRFLGKLSELTDSGVEVHFLTGNHDLWVTDYLKKECGVIVHTEKLVNISIGKKHFCLSHGDGLNNKDHGYLFLRFLFHNKVCRVLFASIHPRWGLGLGYSWAKYSRKKHEGQEGIAVPENKDNTLKFVRSYVQQQPETDYFIIGHRHIDQQNELPNGGKFIILGDWITKFTVASFDGEKLEISHFA